MLFGTDFNLDYGKEENECGKIVCFSFRGKIADGSNKETPRNEAKIQGKCKS